MIDRYRAMRTRAAPYTNTANWAYAGIVLAALWFGFTIIFSAIYVVWAQSSWVADNPLLEDAFFLGSTPSAVRWTLATFAIYTAILLLMMRVFHRLGLRTLIGHAPTACREFIRVSIYLSPLYGFLTLPSVFLPEAERQYDITTWLSLLPMMLPLLFVQISAEEFVFRGYLQSHFAALTSNPIIWMGIPSFLFGLIHFDPTSPAYSAWTYVIWATCLGLVCADLTARSGTLGPALAVHFINNIGAMFILAADDWLYGAALYVWPTYGEPWVPWIPFEALFLFSVWLAARLALRR
ncbi:CPBP family intramembrane metalloprotease [Octadecabacter sp. G9-8]|uniref:CPBP family intramembrane metalloprotease n=1 Tax=Octadecabacter dasysiphoniae TaxID=2909341 RepID=A0ABS9CWR9_9RHOB|nr:CPBP family intramembrane glutamic endopeptidase [Octadecabacter dasysiphoniae]MCF2871731.1 CPBP family intramembrane metalloprotease [Octadecabacter dasysiphoniae]